MQTLSLSSQNPLLHNCANVGKHVCEHSLAKCENGKLDQVWAPLIHVELGLESLGNQSLVEAVNCHPGKIGTFGHARLRVLHEFWTVLNMFWLPVEALVQSVVHKLHDAGDKFERRTLTC